MPAISVAPTRSNLIRVKKDLQFAREGYEILGWKKPASPWEAIMWNGRRSLRTRQWKYNLSFEGSWAWQSR